MVEQKHIKFLRLTALCISVILVILISTSCIKTESVKTPNDVDKDATPSISTKVPDDYVLTITFIDRYADWLQSETCEIWKLMQERTGIKFKFECIQNAQYAEKVKMILAAQQNLPDLISLPGGQLDYLNYFNEGIIISLKDFVNKDSIYIKKYMEKNPDYKASLYTPEGEIPIIHGSTRDYLNFEPVWSWVRLGFLENLNIEMPKTIDEFYNMLVKFKTQDANKNGDPNDEIPLSNTSLAYLYNRICQYFGARTEGDGFNQDANGEVKYHFITDRFREGMAFLNKLYREGLLDEEFSTMTASKLKAKVTNEQVCAYMGFATANTVLTDVDDYFQYTPVLENQYGEKEWIGSVGLGGYNLGITKDCKYPEVAFRWIDECCFNKENYDMFTLGIEGINYKMESGKYTETEWFTNHPERDSFASMTDAIRWLGGTPALPYPYDIDSYYTRGELAIKLGSIHKDQNNIALENIKHLENPFPYLYPEIEDLEIIDTYLKDINSYKNEMIKKFISGEETLDNFDNYVKTINDMGVKEILEVKKKQYARYLDLIKTN